MENSEKSTSVPLATTQRMPNYLRYLRVKQEEGVENISSVTIAEDMNLTAIVVKKDLAFVSKTAGKPKIGFSTRQLIEDIEHFLGYNDTNNAILAGAGKLGKTLLSYEGFKSYGLNIVAGFDADIKLNNTVINGKKVFHVSKMQDLIQRTGILIGIITVPKDYAQEVCNQMIDAGIKAIWNFAPIHLVVPDGIALKNEDMAASLAVLSNKLQMIINEKN